MTFSEIENTSLDVLLDIELLDSKIDAAFSDKKNKKVFIEDIL